MITDAESPTRVSNVTTIHQLAAIQQASDKSVDLAEAVDCAEEAESVIGDAMAIIKIASQGLGRGDARNQQQHDNFENELIRVLGVATYLLDKAADRILSVQSGLQRLKAVKS